MKDGKLNEATRNPAKLLIEILMCRSLCSSCRPSAFSLTQTIRLIRRRRLVAGGRIGKARARRLGGEPPGLGLVLPEHVAEAEQAAVIAEVRRFLRYRGLFGVMPVASRLDFLRWPTFNLSGDSGREFSSIRWLLSKPLSRVAARISFARLISGSTGQFGLFTTVPVSGGGSALFGGITSGGRS